MAVSLETLIDRSTRNMGSGIHPVVKESALEVIRQAYNEGIYVQISSGFRSFSEQNALYAKGRTKPGNVVTNARGGQSYHNFGLAVDYFLVSDDGKDALWVVNNKWRRVADIGKSLGFEWGGDWKSFPDNPHLQMSGGLSLHQLRSGVKPNLVSKVPKKPKGGLTVSEAKKLQSQIDALAKTVREMNYNPNYEIPDYFKAPYQEVIERGISDGGRPGEVAKRIETMMMVLSSTKLDNEHLEIMLKEFRAVKDKLPISDADLWEKRLRNKEIRANEAVFLLFSIIMREYKEGK